MIDPFFGQLDGEAGNLLGQLAGAAGNLLGGGLKPAPAGPATSAPINSLGIDFSNWTVATSGSKATAANDKTTATMPDWLTFAAMALMAVVAVRWATAKN